MYALFEGNTQIGRVFMTEKEVWEAALIEGLVVDVPMPDREDRIVPTGYHVAKVDDLCPPRGDGCHKPYRAER